MMAANWAFVVVVLLTFTLLTSAASALADLDAGEQYIIILPSGGYGVLYATYYDGSLYGTLLRYTNLPAIVYRLDLGTGIVVWEKILKLPDGVALTNIRSVRYVGDNKLLLTSEEGYLIVMDATTGDVIHAWKLEDVSNKVITLMTTYIGSYAGKIYLQIYPIMYYGNSSDRYEAVLNLSKENPIETLVRFPDDPGGSLLFSKSNNGNFFVISTSGKVFVGEFGDGILDVKKAVELTIQGWNLTTAGGIGILGDYLVVGVMNPLIPSYALIWLDRDTLSFKGAFTYTHGDNPVVLSIFKGKPFAMVIRNDVGVQFTVLNARVESPETFRKFVENVLRGDICLWTSYNSTRNRIFGFTYDYEGPVLLWFKPSAIGWYPSLALIDWGLINSNQSSTRTLTYGKNELTLTQICGINVTVQAAWVNEDGTLTPLTESIGGPLKSFSIQASAASPEILKNRIEELIINNPTIRFDPVEIEDYSKDLELKVYKSPLETNTPLASKITPEVAYAGLTVGLAALAMVSFYHSTKGNSRKDSEKSRGNFTGSK